MYFHSRCTNFLVVLLTSLLLAGCFNSSNAPPDNTPPDEDNNPPVAGADVSINVDEGAAIIFGQLTSIDADHGATANFTISGGGSTPDGFALNSDGSFSFDPAHASYEHLNVGDSEVLTIPVTVTDDQGATDTTQIQITVIGTNDAPVAGTAITASVDEGAASISGQLTSTDADDGATASFTITGGSAPDGFVLNSDGNFSFDPAVASYAHLNVGDSEVLTIPVTVTDDQGATDTTQIQITVTGTNDAPVAGAAIATRVDEGAASISGRLTSTDVDDGATANFTITGGGVPDGFALNSNGIFSFNPADASYEHLNVGDSAVLTIPVTVTDDQGATDTTQIQITVTGTNDAPVAGAAITASVDEGAASISGQLTSTDVDDGATALFAISSGSSPPDGFVLNSDGSYSFDPAVASYAHLNVGDIEVLTIPVTVTDDQGATDTTQIQITVTGVNNVPIARDDAYDTFGNTLLEVGVLPSGSIAVIVSGSVLDNDVDLDVDTLTTTLETAPVSGSVTINAQGNFSYAPLAGLTSVTDSFTYRVSDAASSNTATVSISITERIWYVDNRSAGGTGASGDPFATLTDTEFVAEDGDTIYIANGDGTTTGMDSGLTLAIPNISLIGEGEALVINSTILATAGAPPSITNTIGAGITLNAADNTLILGLIIDGTSADGLVVNDSTGVVVEGITISNSGKSAIQGSGADVELTLTDVIIDTVDVTDSSISDDAIFIAATSSSSLVMNGGSINGVPGNLGDGIEFENAVVSNAVSMSLDVRGVSFSDIKQDGIKLDNDNGVMDVQIGGATGAEGNIFDVGFRGIQIQTDEDPTLSRTNSILIQNNTITSANEGIQIRSVDDLTHLSILDNTLNREITGNSSDLIDVQAEFTANPQARINRNDINNVGGSDGIKVRVFDGATLTMEALNNIIDGPTEGFDFDVIETNAAAIDPTTLNITVLNNTLSNIVSVAMNARNADSTSNTCMDLQGNSAVADYELDAVIGSFALTGASQPIVFNPPGGSFSDPGSCPVPAF